MADWRTWRANNQDINIKRWKGRGVFIVNGHRGYDYRVDSLNRSCTCPDWQKKRPEGGCKHLRAVRIGIGEKSHVNSEETTKEVDTANNREAEYPEDWEVRRKNVYRRDDWTCQNCGREGGTKGNSELHAHHIVPVAKGGSNDLSNLTTLCARCHGKVHESVEVKKGFNGESDSSHPSRGTSTVQTRDSNTKPERSDSKSERTRRTTIGDSSTRWTEANSWSDSLKEDRDGTHSVSFDDFVTPSNDESEYEKCPICNLISLDPANGTDDVLTCKSCGTVVKRYSDRKQGGISFGSGNGDSEEGRNAQFLDGVREQASEDPPVDSGIILPPISKDPRRFTSERRFTHDKRRPEGQVDSTIALPHPMKWRPHDSP